MPRAIVFAVSQSTLLAGAELPFYTGVTCTCPCLRRVSIHIRRRPFGRRPSPRHLGPMPDNSEGKAHIALQRVSLRSGRPTKNFRPRLKPQPIRQQAPNTRTVACHQILLRPTRLPRHDQGPGGGKAELLRRGDTLSASSLTPGRPAQTSAQAQPPISLGTLPRPGRRPSGAVSGISQAVDTLIPSAGAKLWTNNVDEWVAKNLAPNKTVTFPAIFSNNRRQTIPHPLGVENIPAPPGLKPLPPSRRPTPSWPKGADRSLELQGCKLDISVVMAEKDASELPQFEPANPS